MNYLSTCSGIEAATCAWHQMGWEPVAFSEIDKFPAAVLAHHYPGVTNEGDFTAIGDKYDLSDGLLVGGTPCQSFSVAGLRGGMDDDRGNLALEFLKLARDSRAKWVVWENVPGVLSSGEGRDFGSILGGLEQLGYGWAYRVLDAQYFGVAQRRRRVFVVGCLGSWQRAASVLFERASLQGNPAPSRAKGKGFTHDIAGCLTASGRGCERTGDTRGQDPVVAVRMMAFGEYIADETASTIKSRDYKDATDLVVVHGTQDPCTSDIAFALGRNNGQENVVAFPQNQSGDVLVGDVAPSMGCNSNATGRNTPKVLVGLQVRRLTPIECERLQGFTDNYTQIPWRGKGATSCPDGLRYHVLGNSMAVPVMRWLGERIEAVDVLERKSSKVDFVN